MVSSFIRVLEAMVLSSSFFETMKLVYFKSSISAKSLSKPLGFVFSLMSSSVPKVFLNVLSFNIFLKLPVLYSISCLMALSEGASGVYLPPAIKELPPGSMWM